MPAPLPPPASAPTAAPPAAPIPTRLAVLTCRRWRTCRAWALEYREYLEYRGVTAIAAGAALVNNSPVEIKAAARRFRIHPPRLGSQLRCQKCCFVRPRPRRECEEAPPLSTS